MVSAGRRDIGRLLVTEVRSPFLKRGMTFANFRLSVKMSVVSDWFTVVVTAFNNSNLTDFNKKKLIYHLHLYCFCDKYFQKIEFNLALQERSSSQYKQITTYDDIVV